jgi:hypothetical protein
MKNQALETWIENGGALWVESSTIYPHDAELITSDDQGAIEELYAERDKEYADMDMESYLKMTARKALEYVGIDPAPYMW